MRRRFTTNVYVYKGDPKSSLSTSRNFFDSSLQSERNDMKLLGSLTGHSTITSAQVLFSVIINIDDIVNHPSRLIVESGNAVVVC